MSKEMHRAYAAPRILGPQRRVRKMTVTILSYIDGSLYQFDQAESYSDEIYDKIVSPYRVFSNRFT